MDAGDIHLNSRAGGITDDARRARLASGSFSDKSVQSVQETVLSAVSETQQLFCHSPIHPIPEGSLPKPQGVNQYCSGKKTRIQTSRAIKVNVRVVVLDVSVIDQVRERFTAIFTLELFHVEPMLKDFRTDVTYISDGEIKVENNCKVVGAWKYSTNGKMRIVCESGEVLELAPTRIQNIRQPDWSSGKLFKPTFTFGNAISGAEVMEHTRVLEYCSSVGGHVFEMYKYQGTFMERFDLAAMPFDRQMLRISIYGEEPLWRQQLAAFRDDSAGGLYSDYGVPTEWLIDRDVHVEHTKIPPVRLIAWELNDDSFRSVLEVVIHLKRVPTFYLWNVVGINFILTLSSAASFASVPDDFNGRSEVQFLLLLTTVGYKLVTAEWLPVKSYMTLMDYYLLLNFGIQVFLIAMTFFCIQFACTLIHDTDGDWMDGEYYGEYKWRTAPDRECWPQLAEFQEFVAVLVYGAWIIAHAVFSFAHWHGYTECLFGAWSRVYDVKGMLGETVQHHDQFPYGDAGGLVSDSSFGSRGQLARQQASRVQWATRRSN